MEEIIRDKEYYINEINAYCFEAKNDLTDKQKQEVIDTVMLAVSSKICGFSEAISNLTDEEFERIVEELAQKFAK